MWIQTRDGSPTLWHNDLAESYRSVKGAFTEAFKVFAEAGLQKVQDYKWHNVQVGEFGLGAGTNWLLWSLAARAKGIKFHYWAIEHDTEAFSLGLQEWPKCARALCDLFKRYPAQFSNEYLSGLTPDFLREEILNLKAPTVFANINAALAAQPSQAQIWFHDPFGYEVNPDGYHLETLKSLEPLWAPQFFACSYACNRYFQQSLMQIPGMQTQRRFSGEHGLKRESLEFFRS